MNKEQNNSTNKLHIQSIYDALLEENKKKQSDKNYENLSILLQKFQNFGDIKKLFFIFTIELEKNTYSETELMAIAQLLYRLTNINSVNVELKKPIPMNSIPSIANIIGNKTLEKSKRFDQKIKEIVKNLISHYNIEIKKNDDYTNNNEGKLAKKLMNVLLSFIIDFTKKEYIHKDNPKNNSDTGSHTPNLVPFNLGKLNNLSRDKKQEIENIKDILNKFKNSQDIDFTLSLIVSQYSINAQEDLSFHFLNALFPYIATSIKKDKIKDILAYIVYVLLKKDINIRLPANIDNKTKNFKNVLLDENLETLLNLIEEEHIKDKIRSLLVLLQEKMKSPNRSNGKINLESSKYFGNFPRFKNNNKWMEGVTMVLSELKK